MTAEEAIRKRLDEFEIMMAEGKLMPEQESSLNEFGKWVLSLLKTDRMGLRTKIETAFTDALEMDGSNADRGMTPSQRILLIRGELITTRNKLCAELESKSA